MICRFLIEQMGWPTAKAIADFGHCRRHQIERNVYIAALNSLEQRQLARNTILAAIRSSSNDTNIAPTTSINAAEQAEANNNASAANHLNGVEDSCLLPNHSHDYEGRTEHTPSESKRVKPAKVELAIAFNAPTGPRRTYEERDRPDNRTEITCPYDESHKTNPLEVHHHLARCRKAYHDRQGARTKFLSCIYDGRHVIPAPELSLHQEYCQAKRIYEGVTTAIARPPIMLSNSNRNPSTSERC
jgi:hypothetical protein